MSNNTYNETGILVLDAVTPVIRALFNRFELDVSFAREPAGQVYLTKINENNMPRWDDINVDLIDLCDALEVQIDGDGETLKDCLSSLCKKFGVDGDETLKRIIESKDFGFDVDFKTLFDIAVRLDDGHGLAALAREGSYRTDRPDLNEFGGEGKYLSKEFALTSNSYDIINFGEKMQTKLASGDAQGCAGLLLDEVTSILSGIKNASQRADIRARLGMLLDGHAPF